MSYTKDEGAETSARNQYFAAFVVSIMLFCQGTEFGWTSPVLATLSDPHATPLDAPLTETQASLVGSLMCLGAFLATPIFGWTSDRYGKKKTGMVSAVLCIASYLLKLVGTTATTLMAARLLAGAAGGVVYVVSAAYLVEVATPKTRGALGSLMLFSLNLGLIAMYAMGAYLAYRTVLGIMLALPAAYLALAWRLPETPVFLVRNGRHKEAAKAIAWLRRVPEDHAVVRDELAALKFDIELTTSDNRKEEVGNVESVASWRYLFLVPSTFKAFCVCFAIFTLQSYVGIIAVLTYANWIFEQAGSTLSANVNSIIIGCLQLFGSVVASSIIERTGRKVLMIGSGVSCSICMLVLGAYFYLRQIGYDVSEIGWVPVMAMSVVLSTFAMGMGPIPYILPNEMIPVQARGFANVLGLSCVWLNLFLVGQFFNFFVELLGLHTVFWCFSLAALSVLVVTFLFVPETKGETLENIIAYYSGSKAKKAKHNCQFV